jgi:hypothetical protein
MYSFRQQPLLERVCAINCRLWLTSAVRFNGKRNVFVADLASHHCGISTACTDGICFTFYLGVKPDQLPE